MGWGDWWERVPGGRSIPLFDLGGDRGNGDGWGARSRERDEEGAKAESAQGRPGEILPTTTARCGVTFFFLFKRVTHCWEKTHILLFLSDFILHICISYMAMNIYEI